MAAEYTCSRKCVAIAVMAASKKINKFLKKVMLVPHRNLNSMPSSASLASTSFESSSTGSSRRSWGSMPDVHYDLESELSSPPPPPDVPAGCLAVYVGIERRRFVIQTSFLTNSVFRALLAKSEEEFGFRCDGGLRIACAPDVFEHLLWWLEGPTAQHEHVEEELELIGLDRSR